MSGEATEATTAEDTNEVDSAVEEDDWKTDEALDLDDLVKAVIRKVVIRSRTEDYHAQHAHEDFSLDLQCVIEDRWTYVCFRVIIANEFVTFHGFARRHWRDDGSADKRRGVQIAASRAAKKLIQAVRAVETKEDVLHRRG